MARPASTTNRSLSLLVCLLLTIEICSTSSSCSVARQQQQDELFPDEQPQQLTQDDNDYLNLITNVAASADESDQIQSSSARASQRSNSSSMADYANFLLATSGNLDDDAESTMDADETILPLGFEFKQQPDEVRYSSLVRTDEQQPSGGYQPNNHFHPQPKHNLFLDANNYDFQQHQQHLFVPSSQFQALAKFSNHNQAPFAEPLKAQQQQLGLNLMPAAPSVASQQLPDDSSPSGAFKIGPQFSKEPPSFIHYLNSSDLVIPCAASGNPAPTISWWHKSGQQLETGSLLDKRYVRYDNSLVISAFKAQEFEPEIHSTTYRCQATNSLGTIVSRDVVINAVIDQDYEVSVPDQFVGVDNDALFKCQLAPQMRELFQVIGWLEDGQQLVSGSNSLVNQLNWQQIQQLFHWRQQQHKQPGEQQQSAGQQSTPAQQRRRQQQQLSAGPQQSTAGRAFLLPDGQLYLARVQLRDANKSFRCQLRNLLNGRISLSSISGRLFVTDSNENGAAPKIVESPRAISFGKLNEQLLLTCLAQGSPRPTVRWFRQQFLPSLQSATINDAGQSLADAAGGKLNDEQKFADWAELPPTTTTTSNLNSSSATASADGQKYLVSSDGNLLLLRSLQLIDQQARFKCLVNNSFGAQQAETQLRLDLWPQSKLIELEPRLEFVSNQSPLVQHHNNNNDNTNQRASQPAAFSLNCTIRQSASQPLHSIEWLKNGQLLYSISLAQFHPGAAINNHLSSYLSAQPELVNQTTASLAGASIFDDPNQELSLVEFNQQHSTADGQQHLDSSLFSSIEPSNAIDQQAGQSQSSDEQRNNFLVLATSLSKLHHQDRQFNEQQQPASHRRLASWPNPWQSVRLLSRDVILYQLHFATPLRRSDRGSFQCRAKLARTIVHSTSQLLLKDNPPQFVDTFPSQLIARQQLNQPASLKCVASGSPLPEISWTLSGFPVPESNRFRSGDYVTRDGLIVSFVNISSVQVEDGGLYECSATNDVGQLRHAAWLNVTGPAYVRPMPNVSAIAGNSLAIMCPVGGWPVEQISWFQNSTKLPLNHRQKLLPNGTLIISELNEVTDSGQYSCQAKSSASSPATTASDEMVALNHVHIQIKVPPLLEPFSFAKSLHRGQRYNIMCTVIRGDLPVSIRWLKDGRPLLLGQQQPLQSQLLLSTIEQANNVVAAGDSPAGGQREQHQQLATNGIIAVKQLDPYSSTLTFASLQANHRGQYTCEATNEAGRANQSSSLVIHVPPEWRIEPRDLSVTVGKTAVIDCQADGFPAARIEWRLSQDLFREPPSEFKPIISSLYMRVFENGSLIIYNTQRSDAGYYLCQANNGIGPGISRVIKLTVHVAAHFKTKIKTELVRLNQPAKLRCESIGDLPVEINWLKDKMPLYSSDEQRYSLVKSQLQDGILSELSISETQRTDSALFTCITQNQFGTDDTNIQLIVQSEPDQPQEVRLHEYDSRSVKISWLPGHSGNSPVTKYLIMYAPVSANSNQPPPPQQQPASSFANISVDGNESSLLLQGLVPLTEYQFQIVALNSIGSSRPLNEPIKFRTEDEPPNLPPLFVKAQAVSSRSLKVRWRVPERRAHFGSISGFYVGYKLISPHHHQQQGATTKAAATQQQQQQDTFVYKTIDFQPANLPGDAMGGGNKSTSQLEQECQLNGLRRGQKYLITVQPFNGRGAGPASEQIVAETWRFDVPDAPSLRMISRTTHSVHLAWRLASSNSISMAGEAGESGKQKVVVRQLASKPSELSDNNLNSNALDPLEDNEQANEPIFGFILTRRQISTSNGNKDNSLAANQGDEPLGQLVEWRLPAAHMSQIVDNLTCGTRYQFTIAALNSVGASAPSEPLVVRTDGSPPVAPDRSSLLSMNSSSVLINLGAWHDGSCQMYSFDILFKTSRSKKWSTLTNYQIAKPTGDSAHNINSTDGKQQQAPIAQRSASSANGGHHHQAGASLPANGTIVLDDLSTSVNYDLKILATNEAGTTEAMYTFNTNGRLHSSNDQFLIGGPGGGDQFDLTTNNLVNELFGGQSNGFLGPFVPFILLLVLVSLALSTGCILLARRRHASSSSCSLSISSASRSNQSASSNYYTNGGGGDNTAKSVLTNNVGSASGTSGTSGTTTSTTLQTRKQLGNNMDSLRELDDVSPNTIQQFNLHHQNGSSTMGHLRHHHHHNQQQLMSHQQIRLGDIYGTATMRHQPIAAGEQQKSNYAYLASTNSPQQTDLTSVLNGSETEMCLGASALNIANGCSAQNNEHDDDDEQQQQHKQLQKQIQSGGYYVAPATLLLANKANNSQQQQQQILLNQLANKSSTLPSNCHQQIMQQLLQQQQQQIEAEGSSANNNNNAQQQLLLSSLVASANANNMISHQQPTNEDEEAAYIQAALQQQQQQQQAAVANQLQLMDSLQHQQQVYATVKRGCPRLPRLCDYSTSAGYQCPGQQCCGGGDPMAATQQQQQKPPPGCFHGDTNAEMLLMNNNICPQQQHQPMATTTIGDYQQLQRPQIN